MIANRKYPKVLFVIFILITIVLVATGIIIYRTELDHSRKAAFDLHQSACIYKKNQIVNWRKERVMDALSMVTDPVIIRILQNSIIISESGQSKLKDKSIQFDKEHIRYHFDFLRQRSEYESIDIVDANGKIMVSSDRLLKSANGITKKFMEEARNQKKILFSDFYFESSKKRFLIDVIAPLFTSKDSSVLLGSFVMHINPDAFINPLINTWPVAGESSSSFLVEARDDSVIFLTQMKPGQKISNNLKLVKGADEILEIKAAQGYTGAYEGRDRNGHQVLAYILSIPDSPWYIVSKTDANEVYYQIKSIWVIVFFLVFTSGGIITTIYFSKLKGSYRDRYVKEMELHKSQERYKLLFMGMSEAFALHQIVTDINGEVVDYTFLEVNPAFETFTGLKKEDIIGKTVLEVLPFTEKSLIKRYGEVALNGVSDRIQYQAKDLGKHFIISVFQTEPNHFATIFDDITQQIQNQEKIRQQAEYLAIINKMIHVISSHYKIESVYEVLAEHLKEIVQFDRTSIILIDKENSEWYIVEGWSQYESGIISGQHHPLGDSVMNRFLNSSIPFIEEEIGAVQSWSETEMLIKDGLHSRLLMPLVVENEVLGILALASKQSGMYHEDIVAILKPIIDQLAIAMHKDLLYQQVQTHAEKLEIKVMERTAELERINSELDSFSYSVSHDLRAPLRAINGFSDALMEDYHDLINADALHYFKRIKSATTRMSSLIDDLLKLSRVNKYTLTIRPTNLSAIVLEILKTHQEESPSRKVRTFIQEEVFATVDPNLFAIVFQNLIDNAWKFTSGIELAEISFGAENHDGKQVYYIRDNGIGFEMKFEHTLFDPFKRLHPVEEFPGSGIGLSIVQRIIHRHGGRVWAKSAPNTGATFYFSI